MRKRKKETNKAASSKAGQALPARILVADDNKAVGDSGSYLLDVMGFEMALASVGGTPRPSLKDWCHGDTPDSMSTPALHPAPSCGLHGKLGPVHHSRLL